MDEHLGHDLFLLMLNLSQLNNPERITALFVEAMNALQDRVTLQSVSEPADGAIIVPIATAHNHFGNIAVTHRQEPVPPSAPLMALVNNAIRMLALILENREQARLLSDRNLTLEAAVQLRTSELQASEQRFRNTFEQAAVGIAHVAVDGRFLRVNQRFCGILGYTPDEARRKQFGDITHPADRPETLAHFEHMLLQDHPQSRITEKRFICKDGTEIWLKLTTSLLKNEDNRPVYFIAVLEDISQRKATEAALARYQERLEERVKARTAALEKEIEERHRIEQQLREQTRQLEVANEELRVLTHLKDEFVSNVSHELRTPITNLMLRQYMLTRSPQDIDQHLAVIQRETKRLSRIIDDLLTLSRMDQGRHAMNLRPIDLNNLARQYVEDRQLMARDKGLALALDGTAANAHAYADEGMIGQALSILLTNAMNYTPPENTVTVSVRERVHEGRHWAGIAVNDTGPGIPREEQPRLFERFYRGKVGEDSGAPGTGLGLAILKEIVDQHGGTVDVHSEGIPGKGATFTIWLPAQERSPGR